MDFELISCEEYRDILFVAGKTEETEVKKYDAENLIDNVKTSNGMLKGFLKGFLTKRLKY